MTHTKNDYNSTRREHFSDTVFSKYLGHTEQFSMTKMAYWRVQSRTFISRIYILI